MDLGLSGNDVRTAHPSVLFHVVLIIVRVYFLIELRRIA
jgi:hypothetical protein